MLPSSPVRPVLAALALAAAAGPCGAADLPPASQKWTEVRTAHFTLLSGASAKRTAEIAHGLETLREVLRQITPDMRAGSMRVSAPVPTLVHVFGEGMGRLAKKDRAGAIALLQRVVREGQDPDLPRLSKETLREIEERRFLERYNLAVSKANLGDVKGALPLMREVAEKAPQKELRERAKGLVAKWSVKK